MHWELVLSGLALLLSAVAVGYAAVKDRNDPYDWNDLSSLVRQLSGDVSRQAIRILDLERMVTDYENIIERLMAQVVRLGGVPEVKLARWAVTRGRESRLLNIYELLNGRFSKEELYDLAFRLGLGRDELAGETHMARAQFLIEYADHRGLIDDLVKVGRELRRDVAWPN